MCVAQEVDASGTVDVNHPNYIRTVLLSKLISYTYWPEKSWPVDKWPEKSWPEKSKLADKRQSKSEDIAICLIASNQNKLNKIAPFINILDNRKSDKGKLRVQNIVIGSVEAKQVANLLPVECRIFYFSDLDDDVLSEIAQVAIQRGVLTVSDTKANLLKGTMVAFIEQRGKLKIYIKTEQLESSGVRLKSSLLRIANRI